MPERLSSRIGLVAAFGLIALAPRAGSARDVEPIVHVVKVPEPGTHVAEVEATVPSGGRASVELMMATWSPGFYRVEDYAGRVRDLSARTADGKALGVERSAKNRWRIDAGGASSVVVLYWLDCDRRSVTTNWVGDDLAVFNGAATFLTTVEPRRRPHEVRLELPGAWKRSVSAMDPAPDGLPDHYRAGDFDTLADSPIVAGNPDVREFEVDGSRHFLVDLGELGRWDGPRAARDLEAIARENRRLWGFLPFRRYYFLNVFRPGRGGLEHKDCTLLTTSPKLGETPRDYPRWLGFVSHEYFHAFNVKRLRPAELGPFDYEHPPRTGSLWVSEGLTSYYGELIVARAGLGTSRGFLSWLSSEIGQLQGTPGRLVQTLEQSSLDVWNSGTSGVGTDKSRAVSYYVKGPIVGFLLDAKVRRATDGARSLDDVMRLAYRRHSGERGFTPEQFRGAAEEVAGVDLGGWFRRAIASTEEMDYSEALDWYGLRFAPSDEAAKPWELEPRPDTTEAQKGRLRALFAPSGGP